MCLRPIVLPLKGIVPCGKCLECKMAASEEWSARICLEAKSCNYNCQFITLTYNDDNLPQEGVKIKEIQDFLKRLRKAIYPLRVRYFACGEYGSKTLRPHYHLIIFGYSFDDLLFLKYDSKKTPLFTSSKLASLWKKGFHSVAAFSPDVAKYCAKYIVADRVDCNKSFLTMSKKPIIGYAACIPDILAGDRIFYSGKSMRIPRAFLRYLEKKYPDEVRLVLENRRKKNALRYGEFLDTIYNKYSQVSLSDTADSDGVVRPCLRAKRLAEIYREVYYEYFLQKKEKMLAFEKKICYTLCKITR